MLDGKPDLTQATDVEDLISALDISLNANAIMTDLFLLTLQFFALAAPMRTTHQR